MSQIKPQICIWQFIDSYTTDWIKSLRSVCRTICYKIVFEKNATKIDQIFKHYIGRKKRVNDDSIINETIKNYPYCHTKKIYNGIKKSIHELSNSNQPPPFCTVKTLGTNKCRLNCRCESVKKKNLKKINKKRLQTFFY